MLIASLLLCFGISAVAQEMSPAMTNAISVCREMSTAIGASTTSQLKAANKALKEADIVNFGDLWLEKGKDLAVDGHFIFDEEFVDSLIVNRGVISFSSTYAKKRSKRGSSGKKDRIKMTTKALKAGDSSIWKTLNRNDAEYAIVAEPGGLFTMTIRDEKGKVLYAETEKNKKGDSVRMARMQLPDKATKLYIEVKNCGKNDASFALLGN